jgi:hypothetical protein
MEHAVTLLDCLRTALESRPEPPGVVSLRHGTAVIPSLGTDTDECCTGLAWVRVVSVEGRWSRDDLAAKCLSASRIATLEMGVYRCLPWGTTGAPPTASQWTNVSVLADEDRHAMEDALCCAWAELSQDGGFPVRAGTYEPLGPDGNCIGGAMSVVLETDCGCGPGG